MKKIFSVLMAVCGFYFAQGQITGADLQVYSVANNNPYAERDSSGAPLPFYVTTITVPFENVTNVARLHVKLGSSEGANDIYNRVFELNGTEIPEDGSSIFLQQSSIYLTLGTFSNQGTYYSEVKAEMSDGSFSVVFGDASP
jgi:hypothetical protein